jgi:Tfp pilus assembly protein PilV
MRCVSRSSFVPGFSLVEAVVALGVLAVAVPLGLAALAGAVASDGAARADAVAPGIVATCLEELRAAKDSGGRWLPALKTGESLAGKSWRLGFSAAGEAVGCVEPETDRTGCRDGRMAYLAKMECSGADEAAGKVRVTVGFPAAARAEVRKKVEFVTRMP